MDRSYNNSQLKSMQIPYHVRNEAGERTGVSSSHQISLIQLPVGSASVSDNNTLQPRKAHKRSKSDIIGLSSMIPLNSPKLNEPKPLETFIGESRKGKEGVCEMQDEEEFEKKINALMDFDFNTFDFNAFNFNENKDEIYINISDLGNENNEIKSGLKTGSASSSVKKRAGQEYVLSSRHHRSVSLDGCFSDDLVEKPPLPPAKFKSIVSSTNSVHENDIFGSDPKRARRMMANRAAAARSKEKKDQRIEYLEQKDMTLKKVIHTFYGQLPVFEKKKKEMMTENQELKIQIESMKEKAKLRDAINKQLNAEATQLKAAIGLNQQLSAQVQRLNVATDVNDI